MPVSISIQHLTKTFGSTNALQDINLEIQPGELFFLLGPSGCGKTTLLRHIAGFYQPNSGHIFIGDEDVTQTPPHRRDTGMVFQSYALWPHMTLAQNVAFGLEMRHTPPAEIKERVHHALEIVKMADRAESKPNQLSGGQQQRIALARALVVQPRCLLLDEPLSNLDAKLRLEMRIEIRRICKEAGLTAVYVTHDQKEALSIADRLAVMRQGVLEQVGTPLEVYRNPHNAFVASFIGETNFLSPTFWGATWAPPAGTSCLSIRPEAIHLGAPPPSQSDCLTLQGHIHGTVYLGETAQHQLDAVGADGSTVTLSLFELNPQFIARDADSKAVTAWIQSRDIIALPQ